jgi:hypothetical protein
MGFLSGSIMGGIIPDLLGMKSDHDANKANQQMQYDFAQKGIQWKVKDAKKAGIHPLYAMGASTQSPSFKVDGQGDNIRNIADKLVNRELQQLQKRNIEADIALKMARASEVSRRSQNMNSQQDADVVRAGEIVQPGAIATPKSKPLKKPTKLELRDSLEGTQVKTPGGNFTIGPETPISIIEETYGQIISEVLGVWKAFSDLNKKEKQMFRHYIKNSAGRVRKLGQSKSINRGAFRP